MKLFGLQSLKDNTIRQIFEQLQAYTESLASDYGIQPAGQQGHHQSIDAPEDPIFDRVSTGGGKFFIQITLPSDNQVGKGPIYYEIWTSTTKPFTSSIDVIKYGPNPSLYWEITDTTTKFLGVRAKFLDSPYTRLVIFQAP